MSATTEQLILRWFAQGEVGISSQALACAIAGIPSRDRVRFGSNWPRDPDDFRRCLLMLDAVPGAREHLTRAAMLGPEWARLVDAWDELEALFLGELKPRTLHDCLGAKCPRTYARMKELGL